jgi:hypothetical protein
VYNFRQIADPQRLIGASRLPISESERREALAKAGRSGEYTAWFRGALLQLFGEPLGDWSDAAYEYLLEATDDQGHAWILTAYERSSGAAIGGNRRDTSILGVAEYLQRVIDSTTPADFERTQYNEEYGTTTTYGCKDGVPYYYEARGRVPRATTDLNALEYQEYLGRISRAIAEFGEHVCLNCEGSGKCHLCDGCGGVAQIRDYDDAGNPIYYPPPYPLCPECQGSGTCRHCGGARVHVESGQR